MAKSQENWLSTVNLGTYKFTLYLTNVKTFNDPTILLNDSSAIRGNQAIIIAESGVTGGYGIDNVAMTSRVIGALDTGGVATSTMQFDLHEPLGFKLLDRILQFKNVFSFASMHGASYVMKLEFQGRDIDTDKPAKFPGVYFYRLHMQQITASVTSAGTRYNMIAAVGFSRAMYPSTSKIDMALKDVRTVQDFVDKLAYEYNRYTEEHERKDVDYDKENQARPKIAFQFDFSAIEIGLDGMMWAGTYDPSKAGSSSIDPTSIEGVRIPVAPGTDIPSFVINEINKNVNAWKRYYEDSHHDSDTPDPVLVIVPEDIKYEDIDLQTRTNKLDVVYHIYVDHSPIIGVTPTVNKTQQEASVARFNNSNITKKYMYLFSGSNTEVLDFNINFNNIFYNARIPMSGRGYAAEAWEGVPAIMHGNELNSNNIGTMGQSLPAKGKGIPSQFLEDIPLSDSVYDLTGAYSYIPRSETSQNNSGHTGAKQDFLVQRALELRARTTDSMVFEVKIKGDPFWLGVPGAIVGQKNSNSGLNENLGGSVDNLLEYMYQGDPAIIFLTYNPDDSIAFPREDEKWSFDRRLDMVSSGVYIINKVTARFQNGEFTQQLEGYRDTSVNTFLLKSHLENY